MQKDQPANKLLRIRQKVASDARQQQSDNEIDCRALMGEGGFGCTCPTGLMAVMCTAIIVVYFRMDAFFCHFDLS